MRNRHWYIDTLIFSFFILLSLIVTYPLIFRMKNLLYGYSGDPHGLVWWFWWWKYAMLNHIPWRSISLLAAPFGLDLTGIFNPLAIHYPALLLTTMTDEIFAYNFMILLTFPLSALMVYYLVHRFTENKLASMFSGILYAFSPYHFSHAYCHLGLAHIQWLPFYLLTLFRLDEKRTYGNALLCALAFSLNFHAESYYGYFALILTITFVLFKMGYGWRERWQGLRNKRLSGYPVTRLSGEQKLGSRIKDPASRMHSFMVILAAISVALALVLPTFYPTLKAVHTAPKAESTVFAPYIRSLQEFFGLSARPLGYLLPSQDNPIFGRYTKDFVKTPFYGGHITEHTLYLGWVGIILSIVAVRGWRRKNKEQVRKWESEPRKVASQQRGKQASGGQRAEAIKLSSYQAIKYSASSIQDQGSRIQKGVSFFLFAGIVALIFSYSPYTEIGNFRIFFPSYFMYKVLPMFRVYARFGILVMLSISVLAGIGLAHILEKITSPGKRGFFFILILLLVFVEFAPTLPTAAIETSPPPVYQWLAQEEGDFIIAEYPVETDYYYMFYQRIHQKRLVNGALPGTPAYEVRNKISDILNPRTPGILKFLGVRYVILHPDRYLMSEDVPIIGEVPHLTKQSGLELVKIFNGVPVYKVTAQPIRPLD